MNDFSNKFSHDIFIAIECSIHNQYIIALNEDMIDILKNLKLNRYIGNFRQQLYHNLNEQTNTTIS